MLKPRVSSTTKTRRPERSFWARQHLLRFHLIQNKRMLGLNFAHLGNGFSYLGHGARRLRRLTRARWAAAFPNKAQLINPLAALSSTLKGQVALPFYKAAYLRERYLFSVSAVDSLANKEFNVSIFSTKNNTLAPFVSKTARPTAALSAAQLSLFARLSLLNDISFHIFLTLNVKLKFVLLGFVLPRLRAGLSAGSPLPRLAPKHHFSK